MKEFDPGELADMQNDEKKCIEYEEKISQNALKQKFEVCMHCDEEFDIDDMDKYDGEWICHNCEEKLK